MRKLTTRRSPTARRLGLRAAMALPSPDICEKRRFAMFDLEDFQEATELLRGLAKWWRPCNGLVLVLNIPVPRYLTERQHNAFRNAAIRAYRGHNVEIATLPGTFLDDVLHSSPKYGIASTHDQRSRGE